MKKYRYVSLIKNGCLENSVFKRLTLESDLNSLHPQLAYDDADAQWRVLKEVLSEVGVELNTWDMNVGQAVKLEIHADIQSSKNLRPANNICVLIEPPVVLPGNLVRKRLREYRRVVAQFDEISDLPNFVRLKPYYLSDSRHQLNTKIARRKAICFIGSKKLAYAFCRNELYTARLRYLRYFESRCKELEFDIYGRFWERGFLYEAVPFLPLRAYNIAERILRRLNKVLPLSSLTKSFSCWRGELREDKFKKLQEYDFCLCIENSSYSGYITEKIFDAMNAESIPIYLGAPNISEFVPRDCFIDAREFSSIEELHFALRTMQESTKVLMRSRMKTFLLENSNIYSRKQFARVVFGAVIHALNEVESSDQETFSFEFDKDRK